VRWPSLAFGLGVYAAALVALAPASLIDPRLEHASGGRLRLAEARGSLWAGSGWIEVRDAGGRSGIAKPIAWRVLPGSLLHGRLAAEIRPGRDDKPFALAISLSGIEIADAGVDLPAAALGLGVPKLAPLRLTGEVRVDIPRLSMERGRAEGDATLRWRAAGSALTPVSPLGEYEVHFKAVGSAVHAELRTLAGPLQLEGRGAWASGNPPSFLATARIPAQHQEQLSPLFRLIAVERGAGTFELQIK
jgi:general secretion pathway protein N